MRVAQLLSCESSGRVITITGEPPPRAGDV